MDEITIAKAADALKSKTDEWDCRGSLSGMRPRNLSIGECTLLVRTVVATLTPTPATANATPKLEGGDLACHVESNLTGCLHPEEHEGRCGYSKAALSQQPRPDNAEVETYRYMHEIATKELGYPSILEALEAAPHAGEPRPDGDLREALQPVMHWYQPDEESDRPLLGIVTDVVAGLQNDRDRAESFRRGSGGKYDRDVEHLAEAFTAHRLAEQERVLAIIRKRIDLWESKQEDGTCATSLMEECQDISYAIRSGPSPEPACVSSNPDPLNTSAVVDRELNTTRPPEPVVKEPLTGEREIEIEGGGR